MTLSLLFHAELVLLDINSYSTMISHTVLVSNPGTGQKASSLACPSSLLPWVGVSLLEEWGKEQRFSPAGSGTIHFQVLMSYVGIL